MQNIIELRKGPTNYMKSYEFYDFILDFVDKVKLNDEARKKAEEMKFAVHERYRHATNQCIFRLSENSTTSFRWRIFIIYLGSNRYMEKNI